MVGAISMLTRTRDPRLNSRSRCISSEAVQEFHIICDEKLIRSEQGREPGLSAVRLPAGETERGPELVPTTDTHLNPLIGQMVTIVSSDWPLSVSVTGPDKIFLIHFMTSLSRNSFGCQSTCRMQKHCRKKFWKYDEAETKRLMSTMMLGRCLLLTVMH